MSKSYKTKHTKWVEEFLSSPEWNGYLTFGARSPLPTGKTKPITTKIGYTKKFEAELIKLSRKFKFDVLKPDYTGPFNIITKTGKLDYSTADQLVQTLKKTREYQSYLQNQLAAVKDGNEKSKPGPIKTPKFFAEHVLIGLHIHREDLAGLQLLKDFLEPRGDLESWLNQKLSKSGAWPTTKKDMLSLVAATGEKGDLKKWSHKKRQTLERVMLSYELRKEVKAINIS